MFHEKMLSVSEIHAIIDDAIKNEMQYKNAYIQKNGYQHKETLNQFDARIAALSFLYGKFK